VITSALFDGAADVNAHHRRLCSRVRCHVEDGAVRIDDVGANAGQRDPLVQLGARTIGVEAIGVTRSARIKTDDLAAMLGDELVRKLEGAGVLQGAPGYR
jgi:hypothetical protein